jgi:cytochrome oxidase Cu insertion factor (SCO1/SenC/PrrC family)/cytochrome c biogenesis protein CcdA/thiol-disulfide isomerase/thioredoxin
MTGTLGFAFAAGAVATMNPCGFALLPAYLARQLAGGSPAAGRGHALARALCVGALATAGFLAVFAVAGSTIALGAHAFTGSFPWIGFGVGLLLAAFGLATLLGRQPLLRSLPQLTGAGRRRLPAETLFAVGYGLASLSCALPLFLATLGTALTGSLLASALSFLAYGLGMGTVLTLLAVAAALSRRGFARALRRLLPHIERASGALLLAAGLYVADYWAVALWRPGAGSSAAAPVSAGGRLATHVSTWLAGSAAKSLLLIAAAALLVLALWTLRRRGLSLHRRGVATLEAAAGSRPLRRLAAILAVSALVTVGVAAALVLISPGRAARPLDRSALSGFLDPAAAAPPFALRDQFGRPVRLQGLRGRPVVIAFVYSHCRDVCPLTATRIRATQRALGEDARRIAWLAISVAPRTDTAASVRAFSRRAGLLHSWRYLFRPQSTVLRTLEAYGIQPQLTGASATKAPFLQHSAYVALLDRDGRRIESFTESSLTSRDLTHDLRLVLGESAASATTATSPPPSVPARSTGFHPATPTVGLHQGILSLTGTDVASGRLVDLAAARGRPVVLNAWASWCAGCAAEAPALAAFARAHPEATVVGVDLEDSRTDAAAFVRRFALPFPSIFDHDAVTAARLGVSGLPTTLFLDRRHRIVGRIVGEADRGRFEAGLHRAELSTINR